MDKNHDCISKVRKELKEANSDLGWIRFKLSTIRDTSKENSVLKTGTEIEFSYKHKKRNGDIVEKQGKSFVSHTFCPFCGEKYE